MRAEGSGKSITFVLTPGQRHEVIAFESLMEQGAVASPGPGRPRQRPHRVVGDKGYSSQDIRDYLRRRGIRYTIPRQSSQNRRGPFDQAAYRLRNRVERLFNRLKHCRRIATRYEKLADNYLAMLHIAAIRLWL